MNKIEWRAPAGPKVKRATQEERARARLSPRRPPTRMAMSAAGVPRAQHELVAAETYWKTVSEDGSTKDIVTQAFLAGVDYANKATPK